MITNPRFGWCDFQLGDFYGVASYMNDVPVNTLECVLDALDVNGKGTNACFYDEEGSGYTLVMSENSTYIIEERDEIKLHVFDNIFQRDLVQEVYEDILRYYDGWLDWEPELFPEEKQPRKEKIDRYMARLKEILGL